MVEMLKRLFYFFFKKMLFPDDSNEGQTFYFRFQKAIDSFTLNQTSFSGNLENTLPHTHTQKKYCLRPRKDKAVGVISCE